MRRCAYCQSAIEPNDDVVGCPYCSQPHHAECWRENGGCTVYACRGQNQFPAAHRTQPAPQPTHGTSLAPATVPAPRWQAVGTSGQRRISRSASEALFFGVIAFLFSFFGVGLVFGPVAVHKGLKALREMARDRQLRGQARAWTGQVMGGLGALVSLLILLNFLGCTR
ncbi:MAG: DUF4190 domain-containing protein [Planctomycetes bacterium]|nr:DUF4190 domain-containing protein [Planctomycetota bacterium]